uniref:Uncharacterized protein n=1 Tax=Rhizophora mucronata TaxID=61149 RepID=A0A2P2P5Y8_RHIMU
MPDSPDHSKERLISQNSLHKSVQPSAC